MEVLSPFMGEVFRSLSSLIEKKVDPIWNLDKEIKQLRSTLSSIRVVLDDTDSKHLMEPIILNWLQKLRDAAYDADDILDEWDTVTLVRPFNFLYLNQAKFRSSMAKKVNELREKFIYINDERSNFHWKAGDVQRKAENFQSQRETSSFVNESQIHGRDDEREEIVEELINNVNGHDDLCICPISGIGGIGKTTMAQLVYNHKRVKDHFQVRIWVCGTQDFDVKRIIKTIISSVMRGREPIASDDLDLLQVILQEKLTGVRFLLVLDDVWNQIQDEWNKLECALRCGDKGSSIIVTTRYTRVASISGNSPSGYRLHHLKFLSEEDCWSLFKQNAFRPGNDGSPNLIKIGKEIVKKCGGVPLAAKVLGGLLRFKSLETEWLELNENEIWKLPSSDGNTILPFLKLSYSELSTDHRHCFAYCATLPKHSVMQRNELIHLWMANVLFQPKGRMELEDAGYEIVKELTERSLLEAVEKDEDGNILSVRMHELLHDLACSVTTNECSNVVEGSTRTSVPESTRQLSVSFKMTPSEIMVQSIYESAPNLRTLLMLTWWGSAVPIRFIISNFKCLRALSFKSLEITALPDSIGNLVHLRYLNLSFTRIKSMPESTCRLKNMQTLQFIECSDLEMLPAGMRKMSNLRHLDVTGCNKLSQMPIKMGQIPHLQTLSTFIVGSESGRHIKELQRMDRLGGQLEIKGLEHVTSSNDAKEANLLAKKNLQTLSLTWSPGKVTDAEKVIDALKPHPGLKTLFIKGYPGLAPPSWLESLNLRKLVNVSLDTFARWDCIFSLGKLPHLKTLCLRGMHAVKFFSNNDLVNSFLSLENIELHDMPELVDWMPSTTGNNSGSDEQVCGFPLVTHLVVENCPKLRRLPTLVSLQKLDVKMCNKMLLGSLKNLPRLLSLEIHSFHEETSFPTGMLQYLTALRSLSIHECMRLRVLPQELRSIASLQYFKIERCHGLVSFPEVGRSSLHELKISHCHSLTNLSEGLRNQGNLRFLEISNCPKLDFSTPTFEPLLSLRTLNIGFLPSLISLPGSTDRLVALRYLHIFNCENLKILPDRLHILTNLQTLRIIRCHSELHTRCKEGGGDWPKIRHIPNRIIIETHG